MSGSTQEKLTRVAIVNTDRCKPKKCRQECKRSCPVVRQGINFLLEKSLTFINFLPILILYHHLHISSSVILKISVSTAYLYKV